MVDLRPQSRAAAVLVCALAIGLVVTPPASAQRRAAPGTLPEIVERGTGDMTLVLLGCMSCRWRTWDGFMERNQGRYRMVAATLPGFGGAPIPDLPMNAAAPVWHANAVAAIESLVTSRDLSEIVLVGHSFGGVIAVELAHRLGDRLEAIVFIDAWPTSDRSWFAEEPQERIRRAFSVPADQAHLVEDPDEWQSFNAVSPLLETDRRLAYHGWFMATPPEVVLQYWRENHLVDLNPLLAAIDVPILDLKAIPASADDVEAYRESRRRHLAENGDPPAVRSIFFHGTGHFIHEVRAEEVDRVIADFLEGRPLPDEIPETGPGSTPRR